MNNELKKSLAIIDYGMGNLRSVKRAFEKVGANVKIASKVDELVGIDAVVFPGQGAMTDAMQELRSRGFENFLREWISKDKPFFGICLGLQMLFEHSEEGDVPALGIFPGKVRKFSEKMNLKIPHMGWNTISIMPENSGEIAKNFTLEGESFYFVHSYFVETNEKEIIWSTSDYGTKFVSAIRKGNIFATQFHPEKSQVKGLQLFKNFLESI